MRKISILSEIAKDWFLIFQKIIGMIRTKTICSYIVSDYTFPIKTRNVTHGFCYLVVEIR